MRKRYRNRFLSRVSGVVHVGANSGHERELYDSFGLRVAWIEAIPEVFAELERNIAGYQGQRAFRALITDVDGKEYQFHIANNSGGSSSIFELKHVTEIWPTLAHINTVTLKSTTLPSLFRSEHIDPREYQALVLDTEGSELLVLQGSVPILSNFEYIKTEVADFEGYEGCCQLAEIEAFMACHGYEEFSRNRFANRRRVGSCFDIVYRKSPRAQGASPAE